MSWGISGSHLKGSSAKRDNGVALIFVLVILLVATLIGLSAVNSTLLGTQVAANSSESRTAFQGAESLLAFTKRLTIDDVGPLISLSPTSVSVDSSDLAASSSMAETTLSAIIRYEGCRICAGNSNPCFYFRARAELDRNISGASARHEQGFFVPGTGNGCPL
jgi:hypothetical protein